MAPALIQTTNRTAGTVELPTNRLVGMLPLEMAGAARIAIATDGVTLVTANRDDSSVSLIDTGQLTERLRLPIDAASPHGAAIDPDGQTAYVSFQGTTTTPGGVVVVPVAG